MMPLSQTARPVVSCYQGMQRTWHADQVSSSRNVSHRALSVSTIVSSSSSILRSSSPSEGAGDAALDDVTELAGESPAVFAADFNVCNLLTARDATTLVLDDRRYCSNRSNIGTLGGSGTPCRREWRKSANNEKQSATKPGCSTSALFVSLLIHAASIVT